MITAEEYKSRLQHGHESAVHTYTAGGESPVIQEVEHLDFVLSRAQRANFVIFCSLALRKRMALSRLIGSQFARLALVTGLLTNINPEQH